MTNRPQSDSRQKSTRQVTTGTTAETPASGSEANEDSTVSIDAEMRGDTRTFTGAEFFTVDITAVNEADSAAVPFRVEYHGGSNCSGPVDPGIDPIDRDDIVNHTNDGGEYNLGIWEWDRLPGNTTVTLSLTFRSVPNPALELEPGEREDFRLSFTAIAPERCDLAVSAVEIILTAGGASDDGRRDTTPAPVTPSTAEVPGETVLRHGYKTEVRTRSLLQGTDAQLSDGGPYYVIRNIPQWENHRRAVVTTDYEYVPLWETNDALWVENYVTYQNTPAVIRHHEEKQADAEAKRATYNNRYHWSRFSELLINAAEILTLVKVLDPQEAVPAVWDAFTDVVTWAVVGDDPYKEAFTSMAHSLEAAAWVETLPASTRDFGEGWEEFADTTVNFFDHASNFADIYSAWDDFRNTYNPSGVMDLFRGNLEVDELDDAPGASGAVLVRLTMMALDHFVEEFFRGEARHAATMAALHTVRRALLTDIIDVLEDIQAQAVSPGQLQQYHVKRFVLYQLSAIANNYAGELLTNLQPPMTWLKSVAPGDSPSERVDAHRTWAEEYRRRALTAFRSHAAAQTDITARLEQSLNAVVYDMEELS